MNVSRATKAKKGHKDQKGQNNIFIHREEKYKKFQTAGRKIIFPSRERKKIFPSRDRKKIIPSREGKNFFLPCLFSTFALPGKGNFFFFPAFWPFLAFFAEKGQNTYFWFKKGVGSFFREASENMN